VLGLPDSIKVGQANALREHGASVVVQDLGELLERP
jgi:hypothetical protein